MKFLRAILLVLPLCHGPLNGETIEQKIQGVRNELAAAEKDNALAKIEQLEDKLKELTAELAARGEGSGKSPAAEAKPADEGGENSKTTENENPLGDGTLVVDGEKMAPTSGDISTMEKNVTAWINRQGSAPEVRHSESGAAGEFGSEMPSAESTASGSRNNAQPPFPREGFMVERVAKPTGGETLRLFAWSLDDPSFEAKVKQAMGEKIKVMREVMSAQIPSSSASTSESGGSFASNNPNINLSSQSKVENTLINDTKDSALEKDGKAKKLDAGKAAPGSGLSFEDGVKVGKALANPFTKMKEEFSGVMGTSEIDLPEVSVPSRLKEGGPGMKNRPNRNPSGEFGDNAIAQEAKKRMNGIEVILAILVAGGITGLFWFFWKQTKKKTAKVSSTNQISPTPPAPQEEKQSKEKRRSETVWEATVHKKRT